MSARNRIWQSSDDEADDLGGRQVPRRQRKRKKPASRPRLSKAKRKAGGNAYGGMHQRRNKRSNW